MKSLKLAVGVLCIFSSTLTTGSIEKTAETLFKQDIVKFGEFRLKSNTLSPIYINLRSIISSPDLLEDIAQQYVAIIKEKNISCDRITGIAYGALGIAFRVATILNKPFLLVEKDEGKKHCTKYNGIIGNYKKEETVLLIEDIATTGGSTIRVANKLRKQGLIVTDAIVFLDRQANAKNNLAQKNITMHSVMTLSRLLVLLQQKQLVDTQTYNEVQEWMRAQKIPQKTKKMNFQTNLCGCTLKTPFVLSSGVWKTQSDSLLQAVNGGCGAVTTKSVSMQPKLGHEKPIHFDWRIGFINAEGLPGQGAKKTAEIIQEFKNKTPTPVIASIFGHDIEDFVQACEEILHGNPDIVEINMSCPNVQHECGTPFACETDSAAKVIKAIKKVCSKPLFAKLAPNVPDIAAIACGCVNAGADGITVINTMPGMVIDATTGNLF